MQTQKLANGWALRLDRDEEIVAALAGWAAEHDVRSGAISGIGAVGEAELGFFRRSDRSYERRVFTGEFEILSLIGNLSELEGRPFPHCHLTLAGPDFVSHGGHLMRGIVTVSCEIQVLTAGDTLRRVLRKSLGFNPLELR